MSTPLAITVFNPPYGIDQTNTRMWLRGKALFSSGSYITGGLQPTSGWNPLAQANGENVLIPTYTQPSVANITNSALTSNVVTLTAANNLVAGQYVTFGNLTNCPFLNGLTLIVQSSGLSATAFEVDYTHANVTSAAETGQAVTVIGPDDMVLTSQAGSGYFYFYNKSYATIQIFEVAGFTPGGTAAAQVFTGTPVTPTISIASGTPTTYPVGTAANTGTTTLVATAAVTVDANSITPAGTNASSAVTGTPVAAGPLVELAAGALPSSVTGDVINWYATYCKQ